MKRLWVYICMALALGELLAMTDKFTFCVYCIVLFLWILKQAYKSGKVRLILLVFVFIGGILRVEYEDYKIHSNEKNFRSSEHILKVRDIKFHERSIRLDFKGAYTYISKDKFEACFGDKPVVGATVYLQGKAKRIAGASNEGEFDNRLYHYSKSIYFEIRTREIRYIKPPAVPFELYRWKRDIIKRLLELYETRDAGFIIALILGDKGYLDKDMYHLYQKSGIAHILAISGLHISLIGMGLYHILRKKCILPTRASILLTTVFLIFYMLLTGGQVSVWRAVAMLAIFFISILLGRTYDLLSAVSLVACWILLWNPYYIYQMAFVLSFMAVFAIGIASEYMIFRYQIKDKNMQLWLIAITIQILNLPFFAYFFYGIPLYAILLNLIIIPLTSYLLIACLSTVVFVCLRILEYTCIGGIHYALQLYEALLRIFQSLPCSYILLGRPKLWRMCIYYMFFYILLLFLYHYKDICLIYLQKKGIKRVYLYITSILLYLFAIALLLPISSPSTRLTFLDVGQGDGIYMKNGKEDILIDCGSSSNSALGERVLKPFLLSNAVGDIEKVFISHADKDHISAILWILEQEDDILIHEIYLPIQARFDTRYDILRKAAKNTKIIYLQAGDRIHMERGDFLCLSPREDRHYPNINEHSMVLLYEERGFRALFTGDIGFMAEEDMLERYSDSLGQMDLLKVGHHGSRYSTHEDFVKRVLPEYAILSYGEGNTYGHPSREVIECLERYGSDIYHTGLSGMIDMYIEKNKIRIKEYR